MTKKQPAAAAKNNHSHSHAHSHAHVPLAPSASSSSSHGLRMSSAIKTIVSKKKRRYVEDGFNLDLSYIGGENRIIAMGFPAENVESIFRNSLEDVKRFLDQKHKDHYFIYNLCSERFYDKKKFDNRVATYPFDDHNPPDFSIIQPFCEHVQEWLSKDSANVAVVHCKAGKGRTGVMICCYLLHSRRFQTAEEVLRFYGKERTMDMKGVTIPSQRRYINYYADLMQRGLTYKPVVLYLRSIVLSPVPQLGGNEFYLSFEVKQRDKKLYQSPDYLIKRSGHGSGSSTSSLTGGPSAAAAANGRVQFELAQPILVCSDVKIEFSSKFVVGFLPHKIVQPKKEFHLWFNTFFVDSAFSSRLSQGGDSVAAAAAGPAPERQRKNHNSSASSSSEESNGHVLKGPHTNFIVSYPPPERHVSETGGGSPQAAGASGALAEDSDGVAALSNLMTVASVSDDHLLHSNSSKDDSALLSSTKSASGAGDRPGPGSHPSVHHTIHSVSSSSSSCSSSSHHLASNVAASALGAMDPALCVGATGSGGPGGAPPSSAPHIQSFSDGGVPDRRTRHRSVPQPASSRLLHAPAPHASHLAPNPLPEGTPVSLQLSKDQIDKVHKDRQCKSVPEDFRVTLFLLRPNDQSDAVNHSTSPSCPARGSPCVAAKGAPGCEPGKPATSSSSSSSEEDTTDSEAVGVTGNGSAAAPQGQPLQRAASYQPPFTPQTAVAMGQQQQQQQQQAANNVRNNSNNNNNGNNSNAGAGIQSDWV